MQLGWRGVFPAVDAGARRIEMLSAVESVESVAGALFDRGILVDSVGIWISWGIVHVPPSREEGEGEGEGEGAKLSVKY